jgi:hypothetical protein
VVESIAVVRLVAERFVAAGVLNFETCVLEKRDGRWLLVSRSVWRVPQ